jgi:hypothetical protein
MITDTFAGRIEDRGLTIEDWLDNASSILDRQSSIPERLN